MAAAPKHNRMAQETYPDRFEAMVESSQDSIISSDPSGRIVSWNHAAEKLFGYCKAQAIGSKLSLLIPKRYHNDHFAGMQRVRDSGVSRMAGSTVELIGLRADGSEFPLEMSLSKYHKDDELYFTGIIRDISERRAIADRLRASEAAVKEELKFSKTLSSLAPDQIFVKDLDSGRILYENRPLAALLGYAPAEVLALGPDFISSRVHADDRIFLTTHGDRFDELARKGVVAFECRYLDKANIWRTFLIRETIYEKTRDGRITQILGVAQDISKRIAIEVELRESHDQLEARVSERTADLEKAREISYRQQQRFNAIMQQIPAAIATIRAEDLVYTSINPSYSALHGHRQLLNASLVDLPQSAESRRYLEQIRNIIATGLSYQGKEISRTADRNGVPEESFMNLVYDPVHDSKGSVHEVIIFCFDVTELVRARREIEAREALFRTLAETLPQIVWMSDAKGGILYFNPQWYRYTGLKQANKGEMNWAEVIHPDDLPVLHKEAQDCIREGRSFQAEYRVKKHDGTYRWHLGRSLLIANGDHKDGHKIGSATDIHDQKEAQQTISEMKARTDSVIQHAPILLWAVNNQGIFTFYDGKVRSALGITTEQRIGANILELYRGNPHIAGNVERALRGETIEDESQVGGISLENRFSPQFDAEGRISGVIGLSIDITQRKKAETRMLEASTSAQIALESSKLKSEFLANMSHEIRTPLNGVIGMAGLLLDLLQGGEERGYVTAIQRSGEILLSLVNDILDFSKIESGKLEFETRPYDFREVFYDVEKSQNFIIADKGLKFRLELSQDLPHWVEGDSRRLRQIVLNLISNAIKFTKEGLILVRVSLVGQIQSEATIKVEVMDSGIGIGPETLARLFLPFTQADASTARRYGGSGLGLSICKGLVEQMGGEIGAESKIDQGSIFWFKIRVRAVAKTKDLAQPESFPHLREAFPARILVAEDNAINQVIARKMLEKLGFQVDIVGNGIEVLAALETKVYDLIMMDCQMPEMDGYQATTAIRGSKALPNSQIPIIAMTANAMRGDEEKCLACGMSDYVSKPVKPQVLFEAIRRNLTKA